MKTGCTLPEIATAHGWTTTGYQLERTMACKHGVAQPHRTTVGMQWIKNMVAQIFHGIVEIYELCNLVAGKIGRSDACWLGT